MGKGNRVPLHPQVRSLLDAMAKLDSPPVSQMPLEEARASYRRLALLQEIEEVARVDDRLVPGVAGDIPVRVYTPADAVAGHVGVLLWFHGGGWTIGGLDTADPTCRALANRSGAVVVSVDYRLSPEHSAPAALEDCLTALMWTVENGELLGVDVSKVAVGGDSAGGNLAALVCHRVRDEFGPEIDFQLLVYPVTDLTLSQPSIEENGEGYLLTRETMIWFAGNYLGDADPKSAAVSPLHAESFAGLPPAMIITAEFDPLRDEGEAYAAALQDAGVPVELLRYEGQIHEFWRMGAMVDDGADALDRAGAALRAVLA